MRWKWAIWKCEEKCRQKSIFRRLQSSWVRNIGFLLTEPHHINAFSSRQHVGVNRREGEWAISFIYNYIYANYVYWLCAACGERTRNAFVAYEIESIELTIWISIINTINPWIIADEKPIKRTKTVFSSICRGFCWLKIQRLDRHRRSASHANAFPNST